MSRVNSIAILLAAYAAVFLQVSFDGVRRLLGAQIDLLPALMVYTSLSSGIIMVALLALFGGLCLDTFSANPLGISVLPLLAIGVLIYQKRELILRDQIYAQLLLGLGASAAAPMLTLLSLWGAGQSPVIGWGSLWQWIVMAIGGAAFTPVCFFMFDRVRRAFSYQPLAESSFRSDREIKRGRR